MVRFCTECGNKLMDGDKKCRNCGAAIMDDIEEDSFETIKNSNALYKANLERNNHTYYSSEIFAFDNVGSKLQSFAKIIFWINVIIGICAALYSLFYAIQVKSFFPVLIALLCLVAGFIIGWLSSVFIYGYGRMIECQEEMVEELQDIKNVVKKNKFK